MSDMARQTYLLSESLRMGCKELRQAMNGLQPHLLAVVPRLHQQLLRKALANKTPQDRTTLLHMHSKEDQDICRSHALGLMTVLGSISTHFHGNLPGRHCFMNKGHLDLYG